jgi:plastocyanin
MKQIEDWGFYLIVAVIVVVLSTLVLTDSLPEKAAAQFNALTDVSIATNYKVLQEPTAGNNTFAYAINEVAAQTFPIAQRDPAIKQIINEAYSSNAAVTIAAIQPTVYEYRNDGKLAHSSSAMLIITVNQQTVDNLQYIQPSTFDNLAGKKGESHQRIWNVIVDLDKAVVTGIMETSDREMSKTLQTNTIYIGMNTFLPNTVKIEPGTTLRWINTSDMPHNIIGVYKTSEGQNIPIDSGFLHKGDSWKYTFGDRGTLDYYCTTHSEDGMKGSVLIAK